MMATPAYAPSVSGNTPFRALCQVLEQVHNTRQSKNQKRTKEDILRAYIDGYRDTWPKLEKVLKRPITPQERGEDLFQLIRLLLPKLDTTRGAYNMRETLLGKEYINLAGLNKNSKKAQELLTYKRFDPEQKTNWRFRKPFETLIFELLDNRLNFKGDDLKIDKINEILDRMTMGREEFRVQLKYLFNHCGALEHKWLVRIMLRSSLKVRKDVRVVLGAIHPQAMDMFAVNHNLRDICMTLHDRDVKLDTPRVSVGKPFGFMLSARTNLATVEDDMQHGEFLMELKYDGERVQIHKNGSQFSFISRGFHEYSHVYGTARANGHTLEEYLSKSIAPHVVTCILDGEMMAYDKQKDAFVTKGHHADVKRMNVDDVVHQQCFVVFDCLYYNGRVLTEEPLVERRRIFESFVAPIKGRVHISKAVSGHSKEDVAAYMQRAIDSREEGIVVKMANGAYCPNERDAGWVKLKADYMNDVITDLDVLVVGAYFADGKSQSSYDTFLVAVAEDPEIGQESRLPQQQHQQQQQQQQQQQPRVFYTFARVHSGLSKALVDRMTAFTGDHWKRFDRQKPPHWLKFSSLSIAPDVVIEPKYSLNVTIKAAELVPNRQFMTGCTTRFARLVAVREDKPWSDCMTYSALQRLRRETDDKLVTGDLENDLKEKRDEARGRRRRRSPQRKIGVQLQNKMAVPVKRVKSDCLAGKEFCIILERGPRETLEKSIRRHGGRCVLSPVANSTYMVIADRLSLRVRDVLRNHDVAKVSWIVECIDSRRLREPGPADFLGMTPETEERLRLHFDRYGDSYRENVTEVMLRNVMDDMRLDSDSVSQAYESGGLAAERLKFRKALLKESGREFAGKSFYLEDGVDFMWHLRVLAFRGIVVDTITEADFVVSAKSAEDDDADRDDIDQHLEVDDVEKGEVGKGMEQVDKANVVASGGSKVVSTAWLEEMIEGF